MKKDKSTLELEERYQKKNCKCTRFEPTYLDPKSKDTELSIMLYRN